MIWSHRNSWGAMRQKMAIFKEGNSVCRELFSGAFILYSERNEQLGAMRQKMAISKERNSVCRVHIFLMLMMMMISCWCCDDDASLSSISFLKSLIAQQPFCKMILIKRFIFWDRRINVIFSSRPYNPSFGKSIISSFQTEPAELAQVCA